jgi:hypothetical protein
MSTTYSFQDVTATIYHSSLGVSRTISGEGMGKITVAYTDNLTESDLGADGAVMVTKVLSARGTITLDIQQTSSANAWLIDRINTLVNADASEWAGWTITITENFDNGITISASSAALVKRPDRNDAQQGDHVSWEFFSPSIAESAT